MTPGEKINYYRKQLGLSQEELGQKLLVSRQTISLWEKGQTVPTIDNLIRLKEIFGVSVDELLGCETEEGVETENLPMPRESYIFNYSWDEFRKVMKFSNIDLMKKCIAVVIVSFFCLIVGLFFEPTKIVAAFIFGSALSALALIFGVMKENKIRLKKAGEKIDKNFYSVKVFEDYFNVSISREDEVVSSYKFYFSEIEHIEENESYLYLTASGLLFILRKSELIKNSVFYSVMYNNPKKTAGAKKNPVWSIVLTVMFVLSIFSVSIAMLLALLIPGEIPWHESCWPFFAVTPIPIASVILGVIFKTKGYKCTKNIVVGLLFTLVLVAFGSAPYMAEDIVDTTDAAIVKAEQVVGIDIPEPQGINTYYWSEDEQLDEREYIYASTDVWFDDTQVVEFEKGISSSEIWVSDIPTALLGLNSSISEPNMYDYVLLYNVDTSEFNTVPEESGTYYFYFIGYLSESNTMQINEYDIEYVK